jgi:membrane protein YqaA with SNARE-associated domain
MSGKSEGAPGANSRKSSSLRLNLIHILTLAAAIAITIYCFTIREQAARLAAYGYPGIFLISVLANATILLPAPGIAVVFAMGSVLNPFLVGVVAGVGASVGEISSYAAGFGGQAVLQRASLYDQIVGWMRRYGTWTILLLAAVPNPFFDLAGMAAGALKMPFTKFFFSCLLGKIAKMLIFAYTGAYSIDWLVNTLK